jgi:hypothetical protein
MNLPRWRKSSYSGGTGQGSCVELFGDLTALRDSKNVTGPVLRANVNELVREIKAGKFDH